jgi:hypothetical protein
MSTPKYIHPCHADSKDSHPFRYDPKYIHPHKYTHLVHTSIHPWYGSKELILRAIFNGSFLHGAMIRSCTSIYEAR